MVRGALDLARITTPDPHAGLPEPEDLGRFSGDLKLYDDSISRLETEFKIAQALKAEEVGSHRRSAHHQLGRSVVRFLPGLTCLRQFSRLRRRVSYVKLRPERRPGGQTKRLHGARLLVVLRA